MKVLVGFVLGVLVVVVTALVVREPLASSGADPPSGSALQELKSVEGVGGESALPRELEPVKSTQVTGREAVSPVGITGRVVQKSGDFIEGATVTFTAIDPIDEDLEPAWYGQEWGTLPRATGTALTDEEGRYVFADFSKVEEHLFVVWASKPNYLAAGIVLRGNEAPTSIPQIALDSKPPISVLVLSGSEPVANAVVKQFGLIPVGYSINSPDEMVGMRRHLARTYETNKEGRALVGRFPGEQILIAQKDDARSVRWRGDPSREVVLRLAGSFTVGGALRLPSWDDLDYGGERRIVASGLRGGVWLDLATLRQVEGDAWGPVTLPLDDTVSQYRIRLEGSPIIPVQTYFAPPQEPHLNVDLETEVGIHVWLEPREPNGKRVMGAEAKVYFRENPNQPWNHVSRRAQADGHINAWSFPPGTIKITATAPGYGAGHAGDISLPMPVEYSIPILFAPGVAVRGRCQYRGDPVRDFKITFWGLGTTGGRTQRSFSDRMNGEFEIPDAPQGELRIVAYTDELVTSQPYSLNTADFETKDEEIVLELEQPLEGRGRIVDASTNEPIEKASLQLLVQSGLLHAGAWGEPHEIKGGEFNVAGFVVGENHLIIRAPGYGDLHTKIYASDRVQDLGTFALSRPVDIVFVLITDQPVDSSQWSVLGPANVPFFPGRTFNEYGEVVYEGVPAGRYTFRLCHPDQSEEFLEVEALAGQETIVEKRLDGPLNLEVDIVPKSSLDQVMWVSANYSSPDGQDTQWVTGAIPDSGIVQFTGIEADDVTVVAFDSNAQPIASVAASGSVGLVSVQLDIEKESSRLVVKGTNGKPIPDVYVLVGRPGQGVLVAGITNGQGECLLGGVREGDFYVDLRHQELGLQVNTLIRGGGRIEVLFNPLGELEFEVEDNGKPLTGVLCRLLGPDGRIVGSPYQSDESGRVHVHPVSEGPYKVRATRSDCWETYFDVTTGGGVPEVAQVRRLGEFLVQVTNPDGLPIASVEVALVSEEFGETARQWREKGRIESPLKTDATGRLRVSGLPNGRYTWRCRLGQAVVEGQAVIPPLGVGQASAVFE